MTDESWYLPGAYGPEPIVGEKGPEPLPLIATSLINEAHRRGYEQAIVCLLGDEAAMAAAERTAEHHIVDDDCVCGGWSDRKEADWDHHMAYVGLAAAADYLSARLTEETTG